MIAGTKFGSFEAMFGFKKLAKFVQVINCPTSAVPPSTEG